jgi:hypothetical protein
MEAQQWTAILLLLLSSLRGAVGQGNFSSLLGHFTLFYSSAGNPALVDGTDVRLNWKNIFSLNLI